MRSVRIFAIAVTLFVLSLPLSLSAQRQTRGGSIVPIDNSNAFIHISAGSNTSFNETTISAEADGTSPLTDNNFNAVVFATRTNLFGSAPHSQPYGVYFSGGNRWSIFNQTPANTMEVNVPFNIQVMATGDNVFIHTATSANTSGHITNLNHPLTVGTPSAIVIVTPRWNGIYNPNEIGVYYTGSDWAIFNQNGENMPINAMFNVQVVKNAVGFTHVANSSNIVNTSKTEIDHPYLNSVPFAQLIVTQNWTVGGGVYNNEAIAVEYDNTTERWYIVNSDGSAMPNNAGFNILISHTGDFFGDGVLYNGGFEVPATPKTTAIKWNTTKAGKGSKRVCNRYAPVVPSDKSLAVIGECSYLLKGTAGVTSKIVQTLTLSPVENANTIDFVGMVKGKNVVGAKIKGVVTLFDNSKVSYTVASAQLNGTYDWKDISASVVFDASLPPTRLQLTISTRGGSLYLDDLSSAIYITIR